MTEKTNLTYGQKTSGVIPEDTTLVNLVRDSYAKKIDMLRDLASFDDVSQEQKEIISVAITHMHTARMWTVRALTWRD